MIDVPIEFTKHNRLTDPGRHAASLDDLPDDVGALLDSVRGLLLHGDYLELYGLPPARWSRETLPVEKRIDEIFSRSGFPLTKSRPLYWRAIVTCRDLAVMTCSFLRHKQIPARVRCGFATYLTAGRYEDHWVCEYWHSGNECWAVADAQLDNVQCRHLGIAFDTARLPDGAFVNASQAWAMYRKDDMDPALFGHGKHRGEWFLWVNLVRDYLAINGNETSRWDSWRSIADHPGELTDDNQRQCDGIAALTTLCKKPNPQAMADHPLMQPFWPA